MIATSSHKYNTNSNMEPRKMTHNLNTRSAIRKAKKRKERMNFIAVVFGIVGFIVLAGTPIHIELEIIDYSGFFKQLFLAAGLFTVGLLFRRK